VYTSIKIISELVSFRIEHILVGFLGKHQGHFLKWQCPSMALLSHDQPKLSDKEFINVSIITALNIQKDRIKELGSV
jgi:hypothetical protein